MSPANYPDTLLLLIHGIRTDAQWQEKLRHAFIDDDTIEVIPIKYGYFDVLRFWFPFGTRKKSVSVVSKKIQNAVKQFPNSKVVVIAHSFGTYAVSKTLQENPLISIDRLVLCGSIVPSDFSWDQIASQFNLSEGSAVRDKVLNECGSKDIWPILAKSTTFGFGSSGTFGFGTAEITDRFHNFRHSDFFTEDFFSKFWIPFVRSGKLVPSEWETKRPPTPVLHQILRLPYNLIFTGVLLFFMAISFNSAYDHFFKYENRFLAFAECYSRIVYPAQLFSVQPSNRNPDQNMLVHIDDEARVYLNSRVLGPGESLKEIAQKEAEKLIIDYQSNGHDWSVISGFFKLEEGGIEYENYVRFRSSHKGKYVHRYEMAHPRPARTNHKYWNINESLAGTLRSDGGINKLSIDNCWVE